MDLMEKLRDKLAEKSFSDPKFQQSREVHMKAFGPILEPAFKDNTVAKIHLTAALNQIGRGDCQSGLMSLKKVHPLCQNDADYAAFFYFMGLAAERSGDALNARQFYIRANEFGHKFYLPYMKVAKEAHASGVFESAAENYRKAIECLNAGDAETIPQFHRLSVSARSNLGSCLTMMHCYDEAEALFDEAQNIQPGMTDLASPRAILYAAKGDKTRVSEQIALLKKDNSAFLPQTAVMTNDILSGKHAHFSALPPERELIAPFWQWFEETEKQLIQALRDQENEKFLSLLAEKLRPIFPFMERELEFGVMFNRDFTHFDVDMADFFCISLNKGYEELLAACPDPLKARWAFKIVH